MDMLIKARGLQKSYGATKALDNIDFDIPAGRIVGVIGPNGAGKTTALKAILGLIPVDGDLHVMGMDPRLERTKLLEDVCFIADTAILPRWMKVSQAIDYVEGVHPKFDRKKAEKFIASTTIKTNSKIRQLSKGMVTQLHLALVMAIDAKLLVLDEPTLGLDILHRKDFYSTLLGDYFDDDKTIIITTHQVEEIENILTDLIFIDQGRVVLNESMEDIPNRFVEVDVNANEVETARAAKPIHERPILGGSAFIFETNDYSAITDLGNLKTPSIADLFVAKMKIKTEAV